MVRSILHLLRKRPFEGVVWFEQKCREGLRRKDVAHADETTVSVREERNWLHVVQAEGLAHCLVDEKQGKQAIDPIGISPDFHGRAWRSISSPLDCSRGLRNNHDLREFVFSEEEEKTPRAKLLADLLILLKKSGDSAGGGGKDHLCPELLRKIENGCGEILERAHSGMLDPRRRIKRGWIKKTKEEIFIERLHRRYQSVLAVLHDFNALFGSRVTERVILMIKLKQKISGAFRSVQGEQYFARKWHYIPAIGLPGAYPYTQGSKPPSLPDGAAHNTARLRLQYAQRDPTEEAPFVVGRNEAGEVSKGFLARAGGNGKLSRREKLQTKKGRRTR
jgi:transposase